MPNTFKVDEKEISKMRELFDRMKDRKKMRMSCSKLIDYHDVR